MTTTTFKNLSLSEPILEAVAARGYDTPTEIQNLAIPPLLSGRDVLATAQTGTGKTAAFVLPMLQLLRAKLAEDSASGGHHRDHRDHNRDTNNHPRDAGGRGGAGRNGSSNRRGRNSHRSGGQRGAANRTNRAPAAPLALILAPTRELAVQIDESITEYGKRSGVRHMAIYGGASRNRQIDELTTHPHVVTATPGRLLDLLSENHLTLRQVSYFVLDEGDRMMDMGFIPDVRRIIARIESVPQAAVFSATMPKEIAELAATILKDPVRLAAEQGELRIDRIDHSVLFVDQANKIELLVDLIEERQMYKAIVFTRTKHRASKVAKVLGKRGIDSDAIHGDKSQAARRRAIGAFKGGSLQVLVATDVASRGLDIDNVTHVVNFEIPNEPETYVHRVGRTARAGADGIALSLCDTAEIAYLRDIEKLMNSTVSVHRDHRFHVEPKPPQRKQGSSKRGRSAGPGAGKSSGRPSSGRGRRPDGGRPDRDGRGGSGRSSRGRSDSRRQGSGRERTDRRWDDRPQSSRGRRRSR